MTGEVRTLGKPYIDHVKDGEDTQYAKVEAWPKSVFPDLCVLQRLMQYG